METSDNWKNDTCQSQNDDLEEKQWQKCSLEWIVVKLKSKYFFAFLATAETLTLELPK